MEGTWPVLESEGEEEVVSGAMGFIQKSWGRGQDRTLGKVVVVRDTDANGSQIMSFSRTSTLNRIFTSWFQCCKTGAVPPCDIAMS